MEKNERRQYRSRINTMKKSIIILLFLISNFTFSQVEKDTIILNQHDIVEKTDTIFNVKTKPIINILSVNKKNGDFLDGLYRINIDDNNYFITNYRKGIEDNAIFNLNKFYHNGQLKQLNIKGYQIIGSKYISIKDYNCHKSKLEGNYIDMQNNHIIEQIKINQKIRNKNLILIIKSKSSTSRIILERNLICICE